MRRNVVGMLGGMGPEATILLQQRVLATITGEGRCRSHSAADRHEPASALAHRSSDRRHRHRSRADPRANGAAAGGCRRHCAGHALQHRPSLCAADRGGGIHPPLNMVDLSVAHVARTIPEGTSIGMLASPAVRQAGVFDPALRRAGLTALWPDDTGRLLGAIRSIKAHGPTPEARRSCGCRDELRAKAPRLFLSHAPNSRCSPPICTPPFQSLTQSMCWRARYVTTPK